MTSTRFALRRVGVRARTTVIATAVVGSGLAVAGLLLVVATRSALYRSVETMAASRAADVATQLAEGTSFDRVPVVRGISVQIVSGGTVVSSTADIEGQRPILDTGVAPGVIRTVEVPALDVADNEGDAGGDDGDDGPYLVAATGVSINGRQATVLAAASLDGVGRATRTLLPLLAIGVPLITLLVAMTIARLTRRAFLPIDEMTRQADTISYSDLHRRVPEPGPDDEIGRLAVVLNRMLDRLDSAASRQRQFTADASHELKSPIATLLTMAEVAGANPDGFTVADLAGDVAEQSRRLAALVDDLLTLAHSDERGLRLRRESFDLARVVFDEVATGAAVGIAVDMDGAAPAVLQADRRRIGQVVRNLLDNAIHHATSTVRVETGLLDGRATLRVGDDGPGIAEADRGRIFERFVRLDEGRSRLAGGTGLGLAVVRSIVDAHGGTIAVGDDPDLGGASITVTLPTGAGG